MLRKNFRTKYRYPFTFAGIIAAILLVDIFEPWISFDMYLKLYPNLNQEKSHYYKVKNLEIFDNYTVIYPNTNYLRVRKQKQASPFERGNIYDPSVLGFQHVVFQHFTRADFSWYGVATPDNFYEPSRKHDGNQMPEGINHTLLIVKKAVVGFSYHVEYGHFVQDMVCGIMTVPSEIIQDADIYVKFDEQQARTYLTFLGFSPERIHQIPKAYVHAIDLYISVSKFGINGLHVAWIDLHNLIFRKYNLSSIKPTRYTIINKPLTNWGSAKNLDKLVMIAKREYPEINWEVHPPEVLFNMNNAAKLLASTLLYVSAAGSACFNCLYMHPGCFVLFFSRWKTDNPAIASALTLGMWLYSINNDDFGSIVSNVSNYLFKTGLHDIMYAIKNGNWRNDIDRRTVLCFNGTIFEKGEKFLAETGKSHAIVKRYSDFEVYHRCIMTKYHNPLSRLYHYLIEKNEESYIYQSKLY